MVISNSMETATTIATKHTEDGNHYNLVKCSHRYVIYKSNASPSMEEAVFSDKVYESSDEEKAREFLKNVKS